MLQRALDVLYGHNNPSTGLPSLEASRAAAALTSLAKELRLGVAKSRRYSSVTIPADFNDELVGIDWRGVEGATGYDISVRPGRVLVTPVFGETPTEAVSSE